MVRTEIFRIDTSYSTYGSSGVKSAGSRVNWGSKFEVRSVSCGSNVGMKGGGISFWASFFMCTK